MSKEIAGTRVIPPLRMILVIRQSKRFWMARKVPDLVHPLLSVALSRSQMQAAATYIFGYILFILFADSTCATSMFS